MLSARLKQLSSSKGFTLIELLIVIAVLGVLAAVVLIAINPVEQIARGRDAGTKNSVSQLGNSISGYYASKQALPGAATWSTDIQNSGDVKVFPAAPAGMVACTNAIAGGGFCYLTDGQATPVNYVVYGNLQSIVEKNKGTCGGVQANTWYVFSSADGKAGTYCGTEATIKTTAQQSPYTFGANLLP